MHIVGLSARRLHSAVRFQQKVRVFGFCVTTGTLCGQILAETSEENFTGLHGKCFSVTSQNHEPLPTEIINENLQNRAEQGRGVCIYVVCKRLEIRWLMIKA